MAQLGEFELMPSYNCFYSCLCTYLGKHFNKGVQMALHNQWQFFYARQFFYNDDFRILGEHPDPFSPQTLERLEKALGVNVIKTRVLSLSDMDEVRRSVKETGAAIVLVNMALFNIAENNPSRFSLMTTAMITGEDKQRKRFQYVLGDDGMVRSGWISENHLLEALVRSPHGRLDNGCCFRITVGGNEVVPDIRRMEEMAQKTAGFLYDSAVEYLEGSCTMNRLYGTKALSGFAEDIKNWRENVGLWSIGNKTGGVSRRLIDSAKYLKMVKGQRLFYMNALKEMSETSFGHEIPYSDWIKQVCQITDQWEKTRMMIFLAGARQQFGTIEYISQSISYLKELEIQFQTQVASVMGKIAC